MEKGKIKTVLAVEDDSNWQDIYKNILGRKGIKVLQATELDKAEELYSLNADKIDLIIMDGCLWADNPNTIDLIKKIRLTFKGPMIASSGSKEYLKELVDAGCDFTFNKASGDFTETFDQAAK